MRMGFGFEERIKSDCAALNGLSDTLLNALPPGSIKAIRDVTRSGLGAVLNEYARFLQGTLVFEPQKLPILNETRKAAEMLGVNPIHLANEGCLCLFVKPEAEADVLRILKEHVYGQHAATIGHVSRLEKPEVVMVTARKRCWKNRSVWTCRVCVSWVGKKERLKCFTGFILVLSLTALRDGV